MSSPPEAGADLADSAMMSAAPRVLVFDVNETLIDIESMTPLFEQMFGDPGVLREWFGQLITYSVTITMSGHYVDFFTLGQGVLQMVADIHAVRLTDDDLHRVKDGMLTMPAHPDVDEGLKALRHNGYRLVTLTNSPVNSDGPTRSNARGWPTTSSASSASTLPASTNRPPSSTTTSPGSWRCRPPRA